MKWHISDTCGNSPKNQMLIDWIQAFFTEKKLQPFIDEASSLIYNGKTQPLLSVTVPTCIEEIFLEKAITHGRIGAVLGKAMVNHHTYPFALFFEFSLGKQPNIIEVNCIVSSKQT